MDERDFTVVTHISDVDKIKSREHGEMQVLDGFEQEVRHGDVLIAIGKPTIR